MKRGGWRTPAAGIFSGALFALAFPPFELPVFAPIALVPWIACSDGGEARRGLLSGVLFAITYGVSRYPGSTRRHPFGGSRRDGSSLGLTVADPRAVDRGHRLVRWRAPARSPWRFAAFPVLWLAAEHARSNVYGGFPWNLTAQALYRHPIWLQSAAFWGAYGVGLLVVATSALIAAGVIRRSRRALAAAAVLVLVVGAGGALRLASASPPGRSVSVALLQPNISQEARLREDLRARNYVEVRDQIRAAAESPAKPDLIAVPESAFPLYWETSGTLRRDLTEVANSCRCAILFNDVEIRPTTATTTWPAAHAGGERPTLPEGPPGPVWRVRAAAEDLLLRRQISTEIGEFSAAEEPRVLRGAEPTLGDRHRHLLRDPLPVLSWKQVRVARPCSSRSPNDSWYGAGGRRRSTSRAPCCGRSRTSATSCAPRSPGSPASRREGPHRAELPADRSGTLHGRAVLFSTRTPWTRYGFAFSGLADALAIGVIVVGLVRWTRARRRGIADS